MSLRSHCDNCDKNVPQDEMHGWLMLTTLQTKATPASLQSMVAHGVPEEMARKMVEAEGVKIEATDLKAVGGVFCTAQCVIDHLAARMVTDGVNQ